MGVLINDSEPGAVMAGLGIVFRVRFLPVWQKEGMFFVF